MIRVVDPTQFPAFPGGQGIEGISNAINDAKRYNNVSIIWVAGNGGNAIVDLGVDALDCDFSIVSINQSGNLGPVNLGVGGPLTSNIMLEHSSGEPWYKLMPKIGSSKGGGWPGGTPNNRIDCQLNNIEDPYPVNTLVHNVTTDTWSIIDSFIDAYKANTTMLGGDVTAHPFDCWFEFHAGIDQISVFNRRISEARGNCLAAGYDYNDPSKLTHDAFVNPGSPAIPTDEYDIFSGNNAAQCYDLAHQPVAIIAPPPSVYNSGVSTRLQIKGTSVYQLEHIVRWRT